MPNSFQVMCFRDIHWIASQPPTPHTPQDSFDPLHIATNPSRLLRLPGACFESIVICTYYPYLPSEATNQPARGTLCGQALHPQRGPGPETYHKSESVGYPLYLSHCIAYWANRVEPLISSSRPRDNEVIRRIEAQTTRAPDPPQLHTRRILLPSRRTPLATSPRSRGGGVI
jgi:hypothetical protein